MVTAEPAYLASQPSPATTELHQQAGSVTEPVSLNSDSGRSDRSENVDLSTSPSMSTDSDDETHTDQADQWATGADKMTTTTCSAVHTLERDMPDYDYSHLVVRLREAILEHAHLNQGTFSPADVEKCRTDDWFLSRFLLRNKMDLQESLEMLKRAMRFNHESLANHLRREDFPAEFYQLGGLIPFGVDRKGNKMLYLRVRLHRKTPEITAIVQAFIYYNIKRLDDEARGKGISLVIDCAGSGIANADMDMLLFIITTLKSYFPKGLSYFLVNELPWILKPFWHIAKAWIPDEHRQLIKFCDSRTVYEYVDANQLPDFMGGLVGESEYKQIPEDCIRLEQAAKLWGIERRLIGRVLDKFKDHLPAETVARIEDYYTAPDSEIESAANVDEDQSATNKMFN